MQSSDRLDRIEAMLDRMAQQNAENAQRHDAVILRHDEAMQRHDAALERIDARLDRASELIQSNARAIEAWRTELIEREEAEREEHLESEGMLEGRLNDLGDRMTSLEQTIQNLINVLGTMMGEVAQIWERLRAS